MQKLIFRSLSTMLIVLLAFSISFAQGDIAEVENNNYFANAMPVDITTREITELDCNFSALEDIDIYMVELSTDSIYHFYSDSSDIMGDTHVELYFGGDTTTNILSASPDGRGWQNNFRIAGWSPQEYGSGTYYIKVNSPDQITAPYTGDYKIRLISQNLDYWANLHEPDNSFQQAFGQFTLPVDGSRFYGMCFNLDDLPTGKDDIDIFYMVGETGKRLWVETEPVQGYPHTRDMDSKIYVYDGDGNELLANNDDKSNQEEDFGSNNVFSLAVIDSLPYDGLYYVIMTSFYAAYNNSGVSQHSDSDPSTGGYVAYSWMGETKTEIEPNDDAANATPLCEGITGVQMGGDNNLVIDASLSSDSDVDWYAFNLKTTKMYTFNTANSSVGGDMKLEVYNKKDLSTNLIDDAVNGRYNSNDFRLSGWIPPENGIYLFKVSGGWGAVGGDNTGEYQFRMGWVTWAKTAQFGEPGNDTQTQWTNPEKSIYYGVGANTNEVKFDSSMTYATIYPADDVDWYWFEGEAGDIIDAELFSAMDWDGSWHRDFDTKMTLVDPNGESVENDDYRPGDESYAGNTFSAVKGYVLKETGTVWIKVDSYYSGADADFGSPAIGAYRLIVYSSAAAPEFAEKEKNDTFPLAMPVPEDKDVLCKFSSASDVDIFAFEMSTDRMYFINSYEDQLGADTHAELFAASDTSTNVLDGSIDGRYHGNSFRLSGFIPAENGTYYLKLTNSSPGLGSYKLRARSSEIATLGSFHEPDNTFAQADAMGDLPLDAVTKTGALYNAADPKFENDMDIYRIQCTAGQMLSAQLLPVGGETWDRDTDTIMMLVDVAGDTVADNDDATGTYSTVNYEVAQSGTHYILVTGYYSSHNGEEANSRNPGVGDYLLKVSGNMTETEPNNSAETANLIPISNNNLIDASFSTEDLEDWFKVELETGKYYYFNSADSKVGQNIQVEVYSQDNPTTNLVDNSLFGRFGSSDFRLSGWTPPTTGTYLLKLFVDISAINDQNIGTYKLRAAGGEVISEVAPLHEPDDSRAQADGQAFLPTDGTQVLACFDTNDDHDMFAFQGTEGYSAEVILAPSHGPRWIREFDTKLTLFNQDSSSMGSNDDWDDWYELNFYMGEVSNTYSRVYYESLPYTGTYYADAFPYYGTYNGKEATIGNNATGTYLISVNVQGPTSVEEEDALPREFALDQNFPNPFNPVTTIQYRLKEPVHVNITIYNIMGQKVRTLVDVKQNTGSYAIQWNSVDDFGQHVASGLYFYRIQAGDKFVKTNKMILMK